MDTQTEERLRAVEVQNAEIITLLRGLVDKMEQRINFSDQWRSRVDSILVGDGNGQKGHNVRLDRLEQTAERQKWMFRSLLVPVVLLALQAAADILTR